MTDDTQGVDDGGSSGETVVEPAAKRVVHREAAECGETMQYIRSGKVMEEAERIKEEAEKREIASKKMLEKAKRVMKKANGDRAEVEAKAGRFEEIEKEHAAAVEPKKTLTIAKTSTRKIGKATLLNIPDADTESMGIAFRLEIRGPNLQFLEEVEVEFGLTNKEWAERSVLYEFLDKLHLQYLHVKGRLRELDEKLDRPKVKVPAGVQQQQHIRETVDGLGLVGRSADLRTKARCGVGASRQ